MHTGSYGRETTLRGSGQQRSGSFAFFFLGCLSLLALPTQAQPKPDLVIEQIEVTPATIYANQTSATIKVHWKNIGSASTSGQFCLKFEILAGSPWYTPSLICYSATYAPGQGTYKAFSPPLFPSQGTYFASATIDVNGQQSESNEGNNNLNKTISVLAAQDTNPPPVPTLQAPANGSSLTDTAPTLDWSSVTDPEGNGTKYDVQVSTSSSFGSIARSASDLTGSGWTVSPALSPGLYYWRARSKDFVGNTSNWSSIFSFTVTDESSKPDLIIEQIEVTPATIYANQTPATVRVHWKNIGSASTSGQFCLRFQIVAGSPWYTPSDTCYTNAYGPSQGAYTTFSPPVFPAQGTYFASATIDVNGQQSEFNEGNNNLNSTINVLAAQDTNPPSAPTLQLPSNGSSITDSAPTLDWSSVIDPEGNGTKYDVQVATSSSFGSIARSASDLTGSGWTVSPALSSSTYYWRARSKDFIGNTSDWSSTFSFSVTEQSAKPDLIIEQIEVTPATIYANQTSATFKVHWKNIGSAPTSGQFCLRFQITAGSPWYTPGDTCYSNSYGAGQGNYATFSPPMFPSQGTYFASAIIDINGQQSESNESNNNLNGTFNVLVAQDSNPPPVPTLLSPANGNSITDTAPTLDWSSVADPEGNGSKYDVQVATSLSFGDIARSASDLTGSGWTVSPALSPGTYYWRARSKDFVGNTSNWSSAFTFNLTVESAKPDLIIEQVEVTPSTIYVNHTPVTVKVHWKNIGSAPTLGQFCLRFQIADGSPWYTPDDTCYSNSYGTGQGTYITFSPPAFPSQGIYFASAIIDVNGQQFESNEANNNLSSTISALVAQDTTPPPVPTLEFPANGSSIADTAPTLNWTTVTDPEGNGTKYDVQVATSSSFDSIARSVDDLTGSGWTVSPALSPGTYYWRARSKDFVSNTSNWSSTSSFSLAPSTALQADFLWNPVPPVLGVPVRFVDASTGGATVWLWDFDSDGSIDSHEHEPTHVFSSPGIYRVTLTIQAGALTSTAVHSVPITKSPSGIELVYEGPNAIVYSSPASLSSVDAADLIVDAILWQVQEELLMEEALKILRLKGPGLLLESISSAIEVSLALQDLIDPVRVIPIGKDLDFSGGAISFTPPSDEDGLYAVVLLDYIDAGLNDINGDRFSTDLTLCLHYLTGLGRTCQTLLTRDELRSFGSPDDLGQVRSYLVLPRMPHRVSNIGGFCFVCEKKVHLYWDARLRYLAAQWDSQVEFNYVRPSDPFYSTQQALAPGVPLVALPMGQVATSPITAKVNFISTNSSAPTAQAEANPTDCTASLAALDQTTGIVQSRNDVPSSGFQTANLGVLRPESWKLRVEARCPVKAEITLTSLDAAADEDSCGGVNSLCLNRQRFRVEATWKDSLGNAGVGHPMSLTSDTGYFWFFTPENVELIVKVLDGRSLDASFWVFYGSLSNVEYELTLTDTVTGAVRRFRNPQGHFGSVGLTSAFFDQAGTSAAFAAHDVAWLSARSPGGSATFDTSAVSNHSKQVFQENADTRERLLTTRAVSLTETFDGPLSAAWTSPSPGSWIASGGLLRHAGSPPNVRTQLVYTPGADWTDYRVEIDMQSQAWYHCCSAIALYFRYRDFENKYLLQAHSDGNVYLMRTVSGQDAIIASASIGSAAIQTPARYAIEVAGSQIKTWRNGVLIITATDAIHSKGTVAIETIHIPGIYDNLAVTTGSSAPSLSISGPSGGEAGEQLVFSAATANCSPAASGWIWTYDGGIPVGVVDGNNLTVAWANAGSKTIRVRNSACGQAAATKQVEIVEASTKPAVMLNQDRFRVTATWRDFAGNVGVGTPVKMTADTAYFWFFNDSNIELVVKVLDGRGLNGKFWVFYGALSNVEYEITITDTVTGVTKHWRNEAGKFGSVGDTSAF